MDILDPPPKPVAVHSLRRLGISLLSSYLRDKVEKEGRVESLSCCLEIKS